MFYSFALCLLKLAKHYFRHLGFRVGCFIGGLDIVDDRRKIQGCRAIVGTPGRILHLVKNNVLNTDHIGIFVLDEADKLMSSSFLADIKSIWGRLNPKRQVLAASATFEGGLDITLTQFMRNPIGVTPKREVPILLGVKQFAYVMSSGDGTSDLSSMQEMFAKIKAIQLIFSMVPFKQCIIFSNSQSRAESYSNYLSQNGWPSDVITGSQDQNVRLKVFKQFKTFQCRILVATDLMARGVDSENVNLIINLDVPSDSVTYLHRIGRCGRFGTQGMAITLLARDIDLSQFQVLLNSLGGTTMSVTKFPHSKTIENMWTYHTVDESDKIFGASKASRNYPVENFDTLKNSSVSTTTTDLEYFNDDAAKPPIETSEQPNEEFSDEKQEAIIDRNLNFLKIASLLIDKPKIQQTAEIENIFAAFDLDESKKSNKRTENESPKLELTDPFEEYDTMCIASKAEPKSVTIPSNMTKNPQHDSVSNKTNDVESVADAEILPYTLEVNTFIQPIEAFFLPSGTQPTVNAESDNFGDPFEAYNYHVNGTTIPCSTNGVGSGLDSINGNDPYESIFQSGIAKKLSSPPTAATTTEVLTTSDTESGSDSINEDEPYEFDVSPKSTLQNTPKWQHLQAEATDTLQLNEDIVIEEYNQKPDKTEPLECKLQIPKTHNIDSTVIDLPNGNYDQTDVIQVNANQLLSSASTIPSNGLLNLNESRDSAADTSGTIFSEEDPFKAYSMLVGGKSTKSLLSITTTADVHAEPTETAIILPTDTNNLFLDAIARLDLYPNTMDKKTENPNGIPFAFDGQGNKNTSSSDKIDGSVLNSNTAGSNAGSSEERLSINDIDESNEADKKNSSVLCSYTASADEINEVAEDGTESSSDGEADDEASACPKTLAPNDAQRKWNNIFMNQLQQIRSFSDYYKLFNRRQFNY